VLSHTLAEQLAAERHAGARAAARVGALARDTMTHARAISRALAPVDLLAEGLGEALERLCESTEAAYDVRCRVETRGDVKVADPAVATHLFRVAQEAVSNAARHAGAREIAVTLAADGDRLRLTVADDGHGMPGGALGVSAGLGLRTMRARAAALGGTLAVASAPDGGTTVTCTVPRPPAHPGA
jgi:two-component system CheB/CheR fusion protein